MLAHIGGDVELSEALRELGRSSVMATVITNGHNGDEQGEAELIRRLVNLPSDQFGESGHAVPTFTKAWHAARVKAKLPGKLRHDCRRTACRDLFAAGVDPFTAIDLVGRKSLATVQRHNIVDLSRPRAGLAKLDAGRYPDVCPTHDGQRGRKGQ